MNTGDIENPFCRSVFAGFTLFLGHVVENGIKKSIWLRRIHRSEVMLWSVSSVFSESISLCRQATVV